MRFAHANAPRIGIILSTVGSLMAALLFFVAATFGGYDSIARLGGSGWVFILSMIILMPIVSDRAARKGA